MLKIGLIGCGGMGSVHANSWIALGDKVQLAAIADPQPEKAKEFCEKTGAKLYPDGEALLANEQLDIIDVCVPTFLHTRYAVAAMEKGMNVFCEKPLCLNREEAEAAACNKRENRHEVPGGAGYPLLGRISLCKTCGGKRRIWQGAVRRIYKAFSQPQMVLGELV